MTSTLGASYLLAGVTHRSAGSVAGTIAGFVIALALIVCGLWITRRSNTSAKVNGVVMTLIGVVFALGDLSSLAGLGGFS